MDIFETAEKTVVETYVRRVPQLVYLTVNGELIQTTVDHPFYVKDVGFVRAGKLCVGNRLLDAGSNVLNVEEVMFETTDVPTTVYNFRVEDFHTYYVGNIYVLVHNAGEGYGKAHTQEQQKLIKEGREMEKRGSIGRTDAEDYVRRCINEGFTQGQVRIDEGHMQRMNSTQPMPGISGKPHLHIPSGKTHSIPIIG